MYIWNFVCTDPLSKDLGTSLWSEAFGPHQTKERIYLYIESKFFPLGVAFIWKKIHLPEKVFLLLFASMGSQTLTKRSKL